MDTSRQKRNHPVLGPMKTTAIQKVPFLIKVCFLALLLLAFGSGKSRAQGLITITNYEGVPLYILGPNFTNSPQIIVLPPAIPDIPDPTFTNPPPLVVIAYTNAYQGGPISIHPGQIIVLPTNVVIFPPPILIPTFPAPFGMITTTNWHRVNFQWQSTPGVKYYVQRSNDETHWTTLKTIMGTGEPISLRNYPIGRRLHYRVISNSPVPGYPPFPPYPPTELSDPITIPFPNGVRQ